MLQGVFSSVAGLICVLWSLPSHSAAHILRAVSKYVARHYPIALQLLSSDFLTRS